MALKAIIFDMGGTIETYGFTRELRLKATPGLRSLFIEAGIDLPLDDEKLLDLVSAGLTRYHELCIQQLDEYSTYRVWSEFILNGIHFDAVKLFEKSEALMFYIETHFYQRAMRPEIPGVLEEIRQMGLKIGLISNVNSLGQVAYNLEKYGLTDYFDPVVCSSQFGRRKPDPAIFHYAARLAETPTSQCLYVGDRISRDVLGAKRAGFRLAIQIRHNFEHGEEDNGAVPDVVIDDMRDLVEIIRKENQATKIVPEGEIQAFIFDAGDILYFRPEGRRLFGEFLRSLNIDPAINHEEEREALAFQAYRGTLNQEEYREQLLRIFGVTRPEDLAKGKKVLQADEDSICFFEGVPETLQSLKDQGYLLGIVTDTANTISSKLRWFESGGFGHLWDSIISSAEYGTRKPDSVLYRAAANQLNITPDQAVFVGHKSSELAGAQAVGMRTVAFNYDSDARADIYIDHFSELANIAIRFDLPIEKHFQR